MKWLRRATILAVLAGVLTAGISVWNSSEQSIVLKIGFPAGNYWGVPSSDCYAIVDRAIWKFEQEHPGVKVEYENGILQRDYTEWLSEQLLRGEEPDVFFVLPDEFAVLASIGALADLNKIAEKDDSFAQTAFYPAALEAGQQNEIQYALPYECMPKLMFVNETLLEKENITVPSGEWTWTEFYDICSEITKDLDGDGQPDQFGCYGYTWQDALYANGMSLFSDDGESCDLNDDSVLDAVSFVVRLQQLNKNATVTQKDFDLGNVAFCPMLFAEYRTYQPYPWRIKKYSSFEWNCIQMPTGDSENHLSELTTLQFGISRRTKHKQLAWELLKTLTYDEEIQSAIYSDSQGCSALLSVTQSDDVLNVLQEATPGQGEKMNLTLLNDTLGDATALPGFRLRSQAIVMTDTLVLEAMKDPDNLKLRLASVQRETNRFLQQ